MKSLRKARRCSLHLITGLLTEIGLKFNLMRTFFRANVIRANYTASRNVIVRYSDAQDAKKRVKEHSDGIEADAEIQRSC